MRKGRDILYEWSNFIDDSCRGERNFGRRSEERKEEVKWIRSRQYIKVEVGPSAEEEGGEKRRKKERGKLERTKKGGKRKKKERNEEIRRQMK